jgi:hypothetical protein
MTTSGLGCIQDMMDPKYVELVGFLADPFDKRSNEKKCVDAGFKHGKYVYQLLRRQDVQMALRKELEAHACATRALRTRKLVEHIANSDPLISLQAIKLSAEIEGDLKNGPNVSVVTVNGQEFGSRIEAWRANRVHAEVKTSGGNGSGNGSGE